MTLDLAERLRLAEGQVEGLAVAPGDRGNLRAVEEFERRYSHGCWFGVVVVKGERANVTTRRMTNPRRPVTCLNSRLFPQKIISQCRYGLQWRTLDNTLDPEGESKKFGRERRDIVEAPSRGNAVQFVLRFPHLPVSQTNMGKKDPMMRNGHWSFPGPRKSETVTLLE